MASSEACRLPTSCPVLGRLFVCFENRYSDCPGLLVGHGDMDVARSKKLRAAGGFAMQGRHRLASRKITHFNLLEAHAQSPTRAESLHHGLLGGKPGSQALVASVLYSMVSQLAVGKHPPEKAIAMPAPQLAYALDRYKIYAYSYYPSHRKRVYYCWRRATTSRHEPPGGQLLQATTKLYD